jgi:transposase
MGKPNFSEDFKRDAVHQIAVRRYAVREVSERLGVSTYSLYKWMKLYAKAASQVVSDKCEPVSARTVRLPLMPRPTGAENGSAKVSHGSGVIISLRAT